MSEIQRYSIRGANVVGAVCGYTHTTDINGEWCKSEDVKQLEADLVAENLSHIGEGILKDKIKELEAENTGLAARRETAVRGANAKIKELEAQLPDEMRHCTILFKECKNGHGRLTATNWAQHDCAVCKIKELEEKEIWLKQQLDGLANFNPDWDLLKATQENLRESWAKIKELEAENTGLAVRRETAYESLERQIKRGDLMEWMNRKNALLKELEDQKEVLLIHIVGEECPRCGENKVVKGCSKGCLACDWQEE